MYLCIPIYINRTSINESPTSIWISSVVKQVLVVCILTYVCFFSVSTFVFYFHFPQNLLKWANIDSWYSLICNQTYWHESLDIWILVFIAEGALASTGGPNPKFGNDDLVHNWILCSASLGQSDITRWMNDWMTETIKVCQLNVLSRQSIDMLVNLKSELEFKNVIDFKRWNIWYDGQPKTLSEYQRGNESPSKTEPVVHVHLYMPMNKWSTMWLMIVCINK